ncbi:MAG: PilZ domain-containing protein [Terriglobia bacterium]
MTKSLDAMTQDVTPKSEERKRRSERVLLRIPIEVKGTDAEGKPFTEKTHTLVINRHGARIGLKAPLKPEARVTITNRQSAMSCPFRVVGRTGKCLGEGPEWGVECLEPGVNFWGISFPDKAAEPTAQEGIDALVECAMCRFRELAQLTLEEYRSMITQGSVHRDCPECGAETEWRFGFAEAEPEEALPAQPSASAPASPAVEGEERRRAKRLTIKLPVRIRLQDGSEEVARTENLSKTGVCFSSSLMIRPEDRVFLTVGYTPGGSEEEVAARLVWRREIEAGATALYGVRLEEEQS